MIRAAVLTDSEDVGRQRHRSFRMCQLRRSAPVSHYEWDMNETGMASVIDRERGAGPGYSEAHYIS
jgi:hypothetical protein